MPLLAILAALALIAGAGIVAIQPDEVPAGPPVQNGNITVDALTVVVAAHDSSAAAKAQADYVCTGTNDHLVIQRAISAAPAGGTVLLLEGTYHCAGTITPRAHSTLKGQGESATVLDFRSGYIRLASQYTILSDLTVTGSGYISITQSHMRLRNVTVTEVDNTFMGAFVIYASGRVIEDVEFTGCRAIDVNRWGFVHTGEGSPNRVKNIRYIDCQAINCGRSGQYRGGWDVGFNIAEVTDAEDILYLRCIAEGAWESGFHTEFLPEKTNVRLIDCVSRNNGQKGPSAWYGAGYMVSKGMILENCTSENNMNGFYCHDGGSSITGCKDSGSKTSFYIESISSPAGLSITASKSLSSSQPVFFVRGAMRNVVLDGITIDAGRQARQTPGIQVAAEVRNPGEILIRNSAIRGYRTGIHNAAEGGLVNVESVLANGAQTPFVNCNVR